MLEVFYNESTNVVTAWRSEGRQGIRPLRDGEAKVMLDIKPPDGTANNYIYDGAKLSLNPDYIKPEPARNLATEFDELKGKLKDKGVID